MTKRTALTGFLVPKCKIYGNGYFSKETSDPDNFNTEFNKLRNKLYDKDIEKTKKEIQKIKDGKSLEDIKYIKNRFERRDGRIVIHRRPIVAKNLGTNQYIISARHPGIGYRKTYRNKDGQIMTYDNRYLIKRRHDPTISSGRYVIKSKNGNYSRIQSRDYKSHQAQ